MAYTHPQQGVPDAQDLRRAAGRWLRSTREAAELTQAQIAERIGWPYYTMVSQVEIGRTRLPPDKIVAWARAVGHNPNEMAKHLLKYYDPHTYLALFADHSKRDEKAFDRLVKEIA